MYIIHISCDIGDNVYDSYTRSHRYGYFKSFWNVPRPRLAGVFMCVRNMQLEWYFMYSNVARPNIPTNSVDEIDTSHFLVRSKIDFWDAVIARVSWSSHLFRLTFNISWLNIFYLIDDPICPKIPVFHQGYCSLCQPSFRAGGKFPRKLGRCIFSNLLTQTILFNLVCQKLRIT